ncbi:MAG: NAD(+)/NADH kinase [Tissierellia bacterium]|nr:NAD(+)/NADH kinase [Tissierellia bacterium]
MTNTINVFKNKSKYSASVYRKIRTILEKNGYIINTQYKSDAILNLVIGGDGTFLHAVHKSKNFDIPFVGINTGHLGFYQEINPDNVEDFVKRFVNKDYNIENLSLLETKFRNRSFLSLNETVVKSSKNQILRLKVFIDGNFLENFSGDGLIVSTPHGSTAYSLSCGGAILYQSLEGFQLTPIAPVSSSTYRSLKNSIVCPKGSKIDIVVSKRDNKHMVYIFDGKDFFTKEYKISIEMSSEKVKKIVLDKNHYWFNIKDKFL